MTEQPDGILPEGEPSVGGRRPGAQRRAVAYTYDPAFVVLNREMEGKFLHGEISFASFDWHLRTICGV